MHRRKPIKMPNIAPIFFFLAAAAVGAFAFCSVVVWVTVPAKERQARDRLSLYKTLAENPNENARLVLEALRQEDEQRLERKARESRGGLLLAGMILVGVGVGLAVMVTTLAEERSGWAVGLIPFLIGCALLASAFVGNRKEAR